MADSIRERIVQNVVTTLKAISVSGGYKNDVPDDRVFRVTSIQNGTLLEFPTIFVRWSDTPLTIWQNEIVDRQLTVTISIMVHDSDPTDAVSEMAGNVETLIEDVQKAMEADVSRGSLAISQEEVEIRQPRFSDVFEAHASTDLVYNIQYRVSRTNPQSQT